MATSPHPRQLSRRERQIMDILYQLDGEASAEDVREKLPDPPSYSAVRAMLVKLENKGFVRHREQGLRYVYLPTAARSVARRSALSQLVKVFFEGSAGQAVTALLDQEDWSEEELKEMSETIARVRRNRRQK